MKVGYEHFISKHSIPIRNLELFEQAVTHRSFLDSKDCDNISRFNERLEFLGDAVLGYVIGSYLFRTCPHKDVGYLSVLQSKIVSRHTLFLISKDMELISVLNVRGMEAHPQLYRPLADAVESIIGAVYLDNDIEVARDFVLRIFQPYILKSIEGIYNVDYKSKLQNYTQKQYNTKPAYKIENTMGPDHAKNYCVSVAIYHRTSVSSDSVHAPPMCYGPCNGSSKKLAEQEVAKLACESLSIF